jgi:penicillin-binding protein 1C
MSEPIKKSVEEDPTNPSPREISDHPETGEVSDVNSSPDNFTKDGSAIGSELNPNGDWSDSSTEIRPTNLEHHIEDEQSSPVLDQDKGHSESGIEEAGEGQVDPPAETEVADSVDSPFEFEEDTVVEVAKGGAQSYPFPEPVTSPQDETDQGGIHENLEDTSPSLVDTVPDVYPQQSMQLIGDGTGHDDGDTAEIRVNKEDRVEEVNGQGDDLDTTESWSRLNEETTQQATHTSQTDEKFKEGDTVPSSVEDTQPVGSGHTPVAPPDSLGKTPPASMPAIDAFGMPLPRRVDEVDVDATRVTPAAYGMPRSRRTRPARIEQTGIPAAFSTPVPKQKTNWAKALGCLLRLTIVGLFFLVLVILGAGSFLLYQYYSIAATLPNVEDLRNKAAQFETTRILDRNGNVLYEILDPNAGRRTYVPLEKISPYLVAATVATEDKEFYSHPGYDATAILRAFLQNYQTGETVSGASTITQQLARTLLFTPEERGSRTYQRKVREAILAAEITRRYSKDEILELYLNEIFYGNLSYGVEAGAQTYFRTSADKLTLAEAAFLAGLPQAPSVYDVYTNRDVTLRRSEQVLFLLYRASQEQGCIYVSNSSQRVCVDALAVAASTNELKSTEFKSPAVEMRFPHWVVYISKQLEEEYDPQTLYRSGFSVYTTIDPVLQEAAQRIVAEKVASLADHNAHNGALVAIDPKTGEILAMVGSANFYGEAIDGQVNMADSPRQPGSAIKPLTYLAAFEKGWTPSTLIWDVPSEFPPSGDPNDRRPPYVPVNYDGRFHGPVTVRDALANSYNIPAVKTLDFIGIYDNPETTREEGLVPFTRRLGITTLTRNDYGLSLTLGGGEVSLLEMTGAFAVLANGGRMVPPVSITRIVDFNGNVVYDYRSPAGEVVVRPEHAFLISSILSDNQSRTPMFGANSVLNLPFQAAAKTGTTNDCRDNWTMGYTPDISVGVWVGNADYTPMQNITGVMGAAPVWAEFMQVAIDRLTGGVPTSFARPAGVIERVICSVSGTEPSEWCPSQRSEFFAADQPPPAKTEDLWKEVVIDTWTGLIASPVCDQFTDERLVINVTDPWAKEWLRHEPQGQAWVEEMGFSTPLFFVADRECRSDDPRPILRFTSPRDGETIRSNPLEIFGQVGATADFEYFQLDYGLKHDPVHWERLVREGSPMTQPGKIYEWDVEDIPPGEVSLRLYIHSVNDTYAEVTVRLHLSLPTPTPTPTDTPTPTPTDTPTPTPTDTPIPTPTPLPTNTPVPTLTPTPPPTPVDPTWTQTLTPQPHEEPPPTETSTPADPTPTPGDGQSTATPTAAPNEPTPTETDKPNSTPAP